MSDTVPVTKIRTLDQAVRIQRLAYEEALSLQSFAVKDIQEAATRAQSLRALAFVWDTARDAARIARGRPLPGSLRPEKKRERVKRSNGTLAIGPIQPVDASITTDVDRNTDQQQPVEPHPDDPATTTDSDQSSDPHRSS